MKKIINLAKTCRIRIILMLTGLFFIITYKILELIPGAQSFVYWNAISRIHNVLASICDHTDLSVAEIVIGVFAITVLVYLIAALIKLVTKKNKIETLFHMLVTIVMCFTLVYGGFCMLWGVYYGTDNIGVSYVCGLYSNGIEHEDLIAVDKYFVNLANEYATKVNRDENNRYIMDEKKVFDHSVDLYDSVAKTFPGLSKPPHRAKPVYFSELVSYIGFTGFFFPFTAEANVNVDSPDYETPAVIAHELAHQRGIAREDEANFVAVLACLEDGDPDYVYSAAMLALVHLQNALYKSGDMDAFNEIYDMYSDEVLSELVYNREYWNKYRKSVSYKASSSTYEAFLKSYDQDQGLETYGACVDLIVTYFKKN